MRQPKYVPNDKAAINPHVNMRRNETPNPSARSAPNTASGDKNSSASMRVIAANVASHGLTRRRCGSVISRKNRWYVSTISSVDRGVSNPMTAQCAKLAFTARNAGARRFHASSRPRSRSENAQATASVAIAQNSPAALAKNSTSHPSLIGIAHIKTQRQFE
jgi:hypothetical protein